MMRDGEEMVLVPANWLRRVLRIILEMNKASASIALDLDNIIPVGERKNEGDD